MNNFKVGDIVTRLSMGDEFVIDALNGEHADLITVRCIRPDKPGLPGQRPVFSEGDVEQNIPDRYNLVRPGAKA